MKGASLKIHYLGCEQSGKLYFQNTVSQTVLQALIINCSGGSSCCLITWSVEAIMSLFYSAQPPVNTVLFPLISSIAQSPRSLPYSGWPGFPDIYTYLCFLYFFLSIWTHSTWCTLFHVFTYTWEPVSHCRSLIGFSWPNLVLQKFVNDTFVIIIIICVLKPIPIWICSGGWASSLFFKL